MIKILALDLDGVLCAFKEKFLELTNEEWGSMRPKDAWYRIRKANQHQPDMFPHSFYGNLDWTIDGQELWNGLKSHNPIIISGLPIGNWSIEGKLYWCEQNLGLPSERIILCLAREKQEKAMKFLDRTDLEGCVLIDDNAQNIANWKSVGGIGILHTSAKESLRIFQDLLKSRE